MSEIKNCPFCGGSPLEDYIEPHEHHMAIKGLKLPEFKGTYIIECSRESCEIRMFDENKQKLIERWNNRK